MTNRHHRLDATPVNDITTGKSGFVDDPQKSRNVQPDSGPGGHWPKLPETDYHHDQGATAPHSPGPFHGDDLVSHGVTAPDVHSGGSTPNSYVDDDNVNREIANTIHMDEFRPEPSVPVRVTDIVVKERHTTSQIITPVLVPQGTAQRVLGKDPTRSRLYLSASAAGAVFVQPDMALSSVASSALPQFGLPVPTAGGAYRFDTEDEIWIYVATDAVTTVTAASTTVTNNQASTTAAGAASTALALPTNGESITGFDVFFQTQAGATTATVTVTNVAGGTLSYNVALPTTGYTLSVRYPNPLPAASAGVAPTVNVPAITSGPAYSVAVYGQVTTTTAAVTVAGIYIDGYAEYVRSADNNAEYFNG